MQRLRRVGLLGILATLGLAASAQAATVIGPSTSNLPSPATLNASGSGWAPNSTVAISQCTIDLSVCKFLRSAPTDASGNFGPVPVTVTRTFTGDGGTVVDCDTEECAVVYVQGTHTVIGPISFAPPPPAPPPPAPPAQLPPAAGPLQAATSDTDPPQTAITQGMRKSETGRVRFRFASDEANSSFECKLKGKGLRRKLRRFRDCDSPRRYKNLDPGRYKFKVRAIDAAGNVDLTPASDRFRVLD